jgi:P-type E1-E2 ATPase
LGVRRTLLLSGDHTPNVRAVAAEVGIHEAKGDLLPEDKVAVVRQLAREGAHVLMVGDGTNDAPALSAADVGIALASHGGGISAEAADVVILADEIGRVPESIEIGRRTLAIARQSIWVGLGLSAAVMVFAAIGDLPPTFGALLQEVIDIVAIANALRASRA